MAFWVSNIIPLLLKPRITTDKLCHFIQLFNLSHIQSIMVLHVIFIYAINYSLIPPQDFFFLNKRTLLRKNLNQVRYKGSPTYRGHKKVALSKSSNSNLKETYSK